MLSIVCVRDMVCIIKVSAQCPCFVSNKVLTCQVNSMSEQKTKKRRKKKVKTAAAVAEKRHAEEEAGVGHMAQPCLHHAAGTV